MDDMNYIHHKVADVDKLLAVLERIARAQEGMLAIAAEARVERLKLSAKMQEAMKRPLGEINEK